MTASSSPSSTHSLSSARPRASVFVAGSLLALALLGLLGSLVWHPSAQATTNAQSSVAPTTGAPSDWSQLSASQRKALAPLASQWASLAPSSRVKWVEVARRFNQLAPAEQARLQERMASWAALPSDQRGEARLRYQQSRQLPAGQRQEKWQAYQALSNEEKQDLGRQAQRRSKPVMLPDRVAGPREPAQAYGNKRATSASGSPAKSNTVPNAVTASPRQPTVVSPATVKAGSGATTNLVTRRPSPPMHQQVGMPKVNAAKGSVDPVTLLPRTGAQGAAMASLPASGQRP
jgi:hypothetical protein